MPNHLTPDEKSTLAALPPFNWREGQRCKGPYELRWDQSLVCLTCSRQLRQSSGQNRHDIPMPDFEHDPAKVCAVFDALDVSLVRPVLNEATRLVCMVTGAPMLPIHIALAKAIVAVVGEH